MWRKDIEIILMRQLASYLAMPIFIVDTQGNLLFFNEPAEQILGRRFEETGWMDSDTWSTVFKPRDADGNILSGNDLPLMRALTTLRPAHRRIWIAGLDGARRTIELTAFPLIGLGDRFVGAVSIFWEFQGQEAERPQTGRLYSASFELARPGPVLDTGRHEIEIILVRQLAHHLAMPMFVVDAGGHLLFYNQAAEPIVGRPFGDIRGMDLETWRTVFHPRDEQGNPLREEDRPLSNALLRRRPSHRRLWAVGLDEEERLVEMTGIPLIGMADRFVGASAIFWEIVGETEADEPE